MLAIAIKKVYEVCKWTVVSGLFLSIFYVDSIVKKVIYLIAFYLCVICNHLPTDAQSFCITMRLAWCLKVTDRSATEVLVEVVSPYHTSLLLDGDSNRADSCVWLQLFSFLYLLKLWNEWNYMYITHWDLHLHVSQKRYRSAILKDLICSSVISTNWL